MSSVRRRLLRPSVVGFVVAAAVLAALYGSALLPDNHGSAAVSDPVFPTTIAPYSLFAGMLSADQIYTASMLYQNGYGVEFMDNPQAVLLGADGSTYRRLGAAEAVTVTVTEDQGDPATSVLSPDGTFVVIGGSAPAGEVEVVTLGDNGRRVVPTLADHTTLPIAIGADGRTVLLATSGTTVNRYGGESDLGLARLDLTTGAFHGYPTITHVQGAALSPDGSRLAVTGQGVTRVLDPASGAERTSFPGFALLDGDAWSPDGRRLALVGQSGTDGASAGEDLIVVDVSGANPVERRHALAASTYGSTAIGWRDDATVLIHTHTSEPEDNTSAMLWVDAATGAETSFAIYRPDGFTGAAIGGVDAARNLAMTWQVADRPVDRGPWPLPLGFAAAVLAGLLALALARLLLPQASPRSVHRDPEGDTPAVHHEPPRVHT